jgi:hypothetical protein
MDLWFYELIYFVLLFDWNSAGTSESVAICHIYILYSFYFVHIELWAFFGGGKWIPFTQFLEPPLRVTQLSVYDYMELWSRWKRKNVISFIRCDILMTLTQTARTSTHATNEITNTQRRQQQIDSQRDVPCLVVFLYCFSFFWYLQLDDHHYIYRCSQDLKADSF